MNLEQRIAEALEEHALDTVLYLVSESEFMCICGKRSDDHAVHTAAVVAGIVQAELAEAWGEGYGAGWNDCLLDLQNGGYVGRKNPYRTPKPTPDKS